MAEHLLDLATATDRPTIRIDGNHYEMRTPEEFSWKDNQLISKRGKRFQVLVNKMQTETGLNDAEGGDLEKIAAEMVDLLVVDIDDETKVKLKPLHQLKIFEAFSTLSQVSPPVETAPDQAAEAETATETPADSESPTPANSSPESSDSTEAIQSTG